MTNVGISYLAIAPTAPATRSAPSSAGLSIKILSPVFTPGAIITDSMPHTLLTAVLIFPVSSGTTELKTAPVISAGSKSCILNTARNSTAN